MRSQNKITFATCLMILVITHTTISFDVYFSSTSCTRLIGKRYARTQRVKGSDFKSRLLIFVSRTALPAPIVWKQLTFLLCTSAIPTIAIMASIMFIMPMILKRLAHVSAVHLERFLRTCTG